MSLSTWAEKPLCRTAFFPAFQQRRKGDCVKTSQPLLGVWCVYVARVSVRAVNHFAARVNAWISPFSKHLKCWPAKVYRLGAFSCHQLTSLQTHFVLSNIWNRLPSISPPSGEHLHLSWLSLDNLHWVLCACWKGQLPSSLKIPFSTIPSVSSLDMTFSPLCAPRRPWAQELTHTEVTQGHLSRPGSFCTLIGLWWSIRECNDG